MKQKEFQRKLSRKLTFNEKVIFFILKFKLMHQQDNANKQRQAVFIFGLVGLGSLFSFHFYRPSL